MLSKKNIPKSQYLKFGECMAYFANTGLFPKYMDENEVKKLYVIWKKHKSLWRKKHWTTKPPMKSASLVL